MKDLSSINDFYQALKEIKFINSGVKEKRQQLEKYWHNYNKKIQNLSLNKDINSKNKELVKLFESTVKFIKESSCEWEDNINNLIKDEKFRSEFKDSFIIIIFGKVKAGKSSLGNFIAENRANQQKIEFFEYDKDGGKTIKSSTESFKTDDTECTIEIQGFELDSLAWVDTPGLGSMTPKNGKLAKKYIENADYIIFPTSENAPLEDTDIQELQGLLRQNKSVNICITKSDKFIEDECDCGSEEGCEKCEDGMIKILENYSKDERKNQEDDVRKRLNKSITSNKELISDVILSISVYTAREGLMKNNSELFQNSNILKFYELLTDVVKNKATKLKKEVPQKRIQSLIENDILGNSKNKEHTIYNIKDAIDDLYKRIQENIRKLERLQDNAKSDWISEINTIVAKHELEINQSNYKNKFKFIEKEITKEVSKIIEKNIKEAMENFSYSFKNLASSLGKKEFTINDVYESYTYTTKTRNKAIGSGIGGTAGGIIGGVFLGPIGAIMGATIGGYGGSKTGEWLSEEYTARERVGDNKNKVIQEFKEYQIKVHEKNAKKIYKDIQNSFFAPLQETTNELKKELSKFEINIKGLL